MFQLMPLESGIQSHKDLKFWVMPTSFIWCHLRETSNLDLVPWWETVVAKVSVDATWEWHPIVRLRVDTYLGNSFSWCHLRVASNQDTRSFYTRFQVSVDATWEWHPIYLPWTMSEMTVLFQLMPLESGIQSAVLLPLLNLSKNCFSWYHLGVVSNPSS